MQYNPCPPQTEPDMKLKNTHASFQGNPTFIMRNHGPRGLLTIERAKDREVLWTSYPLADSVDAVRVDVWHGRFEGPLALGGLLPAGDYEAIAVAENGDRTKLEAFSVVERTLFDLDLTTFGASDLADTRQWQCHGQWTASNHGLVAESGTAHLHVYGAMHGVLQGRFEFADTSNEEVTWGLITRHYNVGNHIRLECLGQANDFELRLLRYESGIPDSDGRNVIASAPHLSVGVGPTEIAWVLNSSIHLVYVNGELSLEAEEAFVGGVTIVGLFAQGPALQWQQLSMTTTQPVAYHHIEREQYAASIRPGNIASLRLTRSAAPDQNLCWESGVQFGHIGGSELKFTQGAELHLEHEGPVATVVSWHGPMPKFVEQCHDVRGTARGQASFYPDRIVMADDVLTWVRRTVGPDFDLLGKIMPGPAWIAMSGSRTFEPWDIKSTDKMVRPANHRHGYPTAVAFPFRLGNQTWWLLAVITLRYPTGPDVTNTMFAWQDPRGLTASHDFRAHPTTPGTDYAHAIVIAWHQSDEREPATDDVLNLRDDWTSPIHIEASTGRIIRYDETREHPREAIDFNDCFDQSTGRYVVAADQNQVRLQLDPGNVHRRALGLTIRQWTGGDDVVCTVDGRALGEPQGVLTQLARPQALWVWLPEPIEKPVELEIHPA